MWWWGVYNQWQAGGFILSAVASWLAYSPAYLPWAFPVLTAGLLMCIRNRFQPTDATPHELDKRMFDEARRRTFFPGLAVCCAGIAAGQIVRVTQNVVPVVDALTTGGVLCAFAAVGTGAYFIFQRRYFSAPPPDNFD